AAKPAAAAALPSNAASDFQRISPRDAYLARLAELVNFDAVRQAKLKIVCDTLHGCGAGYLDRFLATHGISAVSIRSDRDVLLDGVARHYGVTVYQTPVGFKYIGELIKLDKIALGGEESAGVSIRGHVPEKDGILAGLLVAEMVAIRRAPLRDQLKTLFTRAGAEYWPLRTNLHLSEEVKARAVERLQGDFSVFRGRHVPQTDRTDGVT